MDLSHELRELWLMSQVVEKDTELHEVGIGIRSLQDFEVLASHLCSLEVLHFQVQVAHQRYGLVNDL